MEPPPPSPGRGGGGGGGKGGSRGSFFRGARAALACIIVLALAVLYLSYTTVRHWRRSTRSMLAEWRLVSSVLNSNRLLLALTGCADGPDTERLLHELLPAGDDNDDATAAFVDVACVVRESDVAAWPANATRAADRHNARVLVARGDGVGAAWAAALRAFDLDGEERGMGTAAAFDAGCLPRSPQHPLFTLLSARLPALNLTPPTSTHITRTPARRLRHPVPCGGKRRAVLRVAAARGPGAHP